MTFQDEAIVVRHASRGTKVLGFGAAVLAVLGSFWGIVWFIRAYVEAPRVNMPAAMVLASRDSVPVPAPPPKTAATQAAVTQAVATQAAEPKTSDTKSPDTTASVTAEPERPAAAPATTTPATPQRPAATAQANPDASPAGAIADRWFAGNQFGITTHAAAPATPAPPAPAAADLQPATTAPAALTTGSDAEPPIEEVAEGSVPAITGPAPLPRRKPLVTANVKRVETTPFPRPRPDGQTAPQSVWTGVPSSDERFGSQ
jgi:hypothetical protein